MKLVLAGVSLLLVSTFLTVSLTARDAAARPAGGTLGLVAYSTPKEAYTKLIPAFQSTPAGHGVSSTARESPDTGRCSAMWPWCLGRPASGLWEPTA